MQPPLHFYAGVREATVTRVLVVDDEPKLRRALEANLRIRGYEVDLAGTGEAALSLAQQQRPDAVILDLGLPGMSGMDVIRALRRWSRVPIIVLSARGDELAKVDALDLGANDYVTKPFGIGELLARLRAALRTEPPTAAQTVIANDDFTLDLAQRRATVGSTEVHLTPIEWRLVETLTRQADSLVHGTTLLQTVWGPQYGRETNYLRVHLAHVRSKLEPDPRHPRYFITEPGVGYRFVSSGGR